MINIVKTIICDRCKKVIENDDLVWFINQRGEYGSMYDSEHISIDICDSCLDDFMEMLGMNELDD